MAKSIILKKVTAHVAAKDHIPFKFSDEGRTISGKYSIVAVPPGTPFAVEDDDEAESLVERFDGEIVSDIPAATPKK